ncbi:MAG: hypothetical protein ACT452_11525 [Microthrixaceae bacterium]
MARRVVVAVLTLAVLAPAGCSDRQPAKGEARLEVNGQAIVERRDGDEELIDGKTSVRAGDRVELSEGVGRMVLRDGVRLELRAGVGDAANTMLRMGTTPVLEAGDLLVTAPGSTSLAAAGTTVVVEGGAAQVSRVLGMAVAAYDGVVRLDSAGLRREIPALREMRVPALGRPPQRPRPLDYRADDPWDRRFLGAAIDLGRTLEALANGYTQNLDPGEGRTPGFFRLVLPGLDDEPQFDGTLIDLTKPPGETLVGAAISELGRRGSFVDRWRSVFGFRDQGAEWGLVAMDQGVSGTPLLGAIEDAIGSSPLAFGGPRGRGVSTPGRRGPTEGTGPGGSTTTTTTTPTTPPTTPPTTTPPTTLLPPDNPITPILEPILDPAPGPVTDPVDDLVGGLLGL